MKTMKIKLGAVLAVALAAGSAFGGAPAPVAPVTPAAPVAAGEVEKLVSLMSGSWKAKVGAQEVVMNVAPVTLADVPNALYVELSDATAIHNPYRQVILHVILPSALPEILVGMRIAIGFGWTTLVAAEMVAANVGLGQMVLNASNFLRTDIVIMGIVVIGVIAYLFDLLMRWVERRLVPWKGRM